MCKIGYLHPFVWKQKIVLSIKIDVKIKIDKMINLLLVHKYAVILYCSIWSMPYVGVTGNVYSAFY